jgi:hypothetical protein
MEIISLYLGVTIRLSNGVNYTFIDTIANKCKIYRQDGFYYIDDGGPHLFEISPANIRQATVKRPEVKPSKSKSLPSS